jgi:hypothetical protein
MIPFLLSVFDSAACTIVLALSKLENMTMSAIPVFLYKDRIPVFRNFGIPARVLFFIFPPIIPLF